MHAAWVDLALAPPRRTCMLVRLNAQAGKLGGHGMGEEDTCMLASQALCWHMR